MMQGTALVTGADRGIGLEFVKQLADQGIAVVATAKDPDSAKELQDLAKRHKHVCIYGMDVTDEKSVKNVCQEVQEKVKAGIDYLILNAGCAEHGHPWVEAHELKADELMCLFQVNVIGALLCSQHCLPFVKKSEKKVVVSVTTSMASMEKVYEKDYTSAGYRITKAAENMLMRCWARDPEAKDVTYVMVHPGWVDTEMGKSGGREPPLSVADGVKESLQNVILKCDHRMNGKLYNYDGQEFPL